MTDVVDQLTELAITFGVKLLTALLILFVGLWLAQRLRGIVITVMTQRKLDMTLVTFTANLVYAGAVAFVILAALAQLGVQTASFIAVIGAAGLAVGLALQGSLSNFAAGVLLILFRPFRVNDYIEGGGTAGTVQEIQIFTTTLISPDNRVIIVPNSSLLNGNIINYSTKSTRRIDFVFGVSYNDNLDHVKGVILELLAQDTRILKDPGPTVGVLELADSSVNLAVRPWVMSADYWPVYFDLTEAIKKRFDAEGISIPFPQQDVNLYSQSVADSPKQDI